MNDKKSILIDENIHRQLKVYCAENGIQMKEWLEQMISEALTSDENDDEE